MTSKTKDDYREVNGQLIELVETVDGEYMVLINGFQWGGKIDASGAGDATFPSKADAVRAFELLN